MNALYAIDFEQKKALKSLTKREASSIKLLFFLLNKKRCIYYNFGVVKAT